MVLSRLIDIVVPTVFFWSFADFLSFLFKSFLMSTERDEIVSVTDFTAALSDREHKGTVR